MELLKVLFVVAGATYVQARRKGCDIPLSQADDGLKFTASSHAMDREPVKGRFDQPKAWCAKSTVKYKEYLQVNLTNLRHISAVETQGAKWSFREFYVKGFLLSYSINGKKWKFYKSKSRTPSKILPWTQTFTGNTDASSKSFNEIHPSFVAKYLRIFPLEFRNAMCMKAEFYGCRDTVDCTHVVKLGQDERVTISTPSYPLPYRNDAHCNWFVYLPKRESTVSIVAMDFDVGGSASNEAYCDSDVLKVYRNLHAFSKYLIGGYCNNSKNMMPREIKLSTETLRISFTGGKNDGARHRGFSLLLWSSLTDYKTAKACWNSSITLDCSKAEQDIEVIAAYYGRRRNSPICSKNGTTVSAPALYNDSCMAPNVLPKLQTICDYRNVCKIELNDDVFPHDCTSGAPLEMFVVYQCNLTKPLTTTTIPPTTPTTLPTTFATTSEVVQASDPEEKETTTSKPHEATTKILEKTQNVESEPVILIAAIGGGVFLLIMIFITIITCVCCRKNRNKEKAELAKKCVVPSESIESKVIVEPDSLYEKIDELDMDPVRYEAKPNTYSPLHDAHCGMSENPLYQSGGPPKAKSSYDVPSSARYSNHNHVHRPQSTGNPLAPTVQSARNPPLPPTAPEPNYIDVLQSPEELPSSSLPMIKYLEPSKTPPDFCVTIPLERYSDSVETPTGSSGPGDDVYEAMDGSNA